MKYSHIFASINIALISILEAVSINITSGELKFKYDKNKGELSWTADGQKGNLTESDDNWTLTLDSFYVGEGATIKFDKMKDFLNSSSPVGLTILTTGGDLYLGADLTLGGELELAGANLTLQSSQNITITSSINLDGGDSYKDTNKDDHTVDGSNGGTLTLIAAGTVTLDGARISATGGPSEAGGADGGTGVDGETRDPGVGGNGGAIIIEANQLVLEYTDLELDSPPFDLTGGTDVDGTDVDGITYENDQINGSGGSISLTVPGGVTDGDDNPMIEASDFIDLIDQGSGFNPDGGSTFQTDIAITSAIPEPSSSSLLVGGALLLLMPRRRVGASKAA